MNFGLGLVLSFTDNATQGINNAVNSLNTLSQTAGNAMSSLDQMASLRSLSVVADQIGGAFLRAGEKVLSFFGNTINEMNNTGRTLMYAETQFDKLYNRMGAGKEVLKSIQDYAKRSMFEFEDLIPSVVMLKANGIEAFDTIGKSIEGADRNLLDYASDLAAFNPQMRNLYGTGVKAAIGALNEYIAEGNAKSLKTGASLDITGILGEDKGKTIEERTNQIVRLMEKLNMVGMVSSMEGRPEQMLSNMSDVLFDLKGRIANSGVYEEFSKLITIFGDFVFKLSDSELDSIAKSIGSALSSIIKPIQMLATKITDFATKLKELIIQYPMLAKVLSIGGAIVGTLAVLSGIFLKFTSAMSGVSLFMMTFGRNFASLGALIKSGSLKILSALIPMTMKIGILSLAWKTDFAGIRTNVTDFVTGVISSFKHASSVVNGSVKNMRYSVEGLREADTPMSNFTIGLIKIQTFMRALSDGWSDYTLSEENFTKAKELGILPLIEAILDLKYRFGFFKQGFLDGWREIGENVKEAISGFMDNIEGTALENMISGLTDFLQKLASGDTQAWYDFGKSFADFTTKALIFFATLKGIEKILSICAKVSAIISGVAKFGGIIGKIFNPIIQLLGKVFPYITQIIGGIFKVIGLVSSGTATITQALQIVFTPLAGVVSLIGGIVLAVVGFVKQLKDGFSPFWEIIKWIGLALAAVGAVILGICTGPIAAIVAGVVGVVTTIVVLVKQYWNEICSFFSTIGSWIYDNVIQPVASFFVTLWDGIVAGAKAIGKFFTTVASWIFNNVIQPIVNFFVNYIYPFIEKVAEIIAKVFEIIFALAKFAVTWLVDNVITPVGEFFSGLWDGIVGGVTSFIESAKEIIGAIVGWISTNVISPVSEFFSGLWNGIVVGVSSFIEGIKSKFYAIVGWINENVISPIAKVFSNLWKKIEKAFDTVADTVSGVIKGAINSVFNFVGGLINGVIRGINSAIDLINKVPGVSISKITELNVPQLATGGVVESPTNAIIGEAGAEAVVPLENNTEWLGKLATMLNTEMLKASSEMKPTNNLSQNTSVNTSNTNYITNSTSPQTISGDTDNSTVININSGAIQITAKDCSDAEAEKLAKKIMSYIKRQKELEDMANYAI